MCQGFTSSPSLYNAALSRSLSTLSLSEGSALLQYGDDLHIASPTKEQCETDTVALLQHLCREGHKASLSKLQFVQQKVTFLGHVLTPNGKSLSPERISAIVNTLKPLTKKQAMSFLAMCSYCRHFIPNFSVLERPLRDATHARGLTASSKFTWTPEAETSFVNLKKALQSASTLGVPNPDKPFVQCVDEKEGCMTSVGATFKFVWIQLFTLFCECAPSTGEDGGATDWIAAPQVSGGEGRAADTVIDRSVWSCVVLPITRFKRPMQTMRYLCVYLSYNKLSASFINQLSLDCFWSQTARLTLHDCFLQVVKQRNLENWIQRLQEKPKQSFATTLTKIGQ